MNQNIKETTAMLFDMETANYIMRTTIQGIDNELSTLQTPVEPTYHEPVISPYQSNFLDTMSQFAVYGGYAGPFVSIFLTIVGVLAYPIAGMLIIIPMTAALGAITGFILEIINQDSAKHAHYMKKRTAIETAQREHQQALTSYHRSCKKVRQKKVKLERGREKLKAALLTSENLLVDMYNAYGIPRDYRNMIAVGYMMKLAEIGAATRFDGPQSLLHLTYDELRKDRLEQVIGSSSEKIVSALYATSGSKYNRMHHTIEQSNDNCRRLLDQIHQDYAAVDNFLAERNTKVKRYLT